MTHDSGATMGLVLSLIPPTCRRPGGPPSASAVEKDYAEPEVTLTLGEG
ncbi:hypothetical protein GCM10009789_81930 [Kribbella sancticallisti]|uniref:Uncharacterized protein n=1 Tax=Kribbella sancticallisti TaxID=460087 RepID=A0ABP4QM42_9ACTN